MPEIRKKRLRHAVFPILIPVIVFAVSLAAAEFIMRLLYSSGDFMMEGALKETRGIGAMTNAGDIFVPDDELGFRLVHDGKIHSKLGCKPNNYPLDKHLSTRERLLFIGDSVTHRNKIVRSLRSIYGNAEYEYWNAGVTSYNTRQELIYYLRYNRRIRPDHVILTFHNNDFVTTPIAYFDKKGLLVRYFLHRPAPFPVNAWLFKHSLLYRKSIDTLLSWRGKNRDDIIQQVVENLLELKNATESDGARFTVLLLPILAPTDEWSGHETSNHKKALEIFERFGISYIDLSPALDEGVKKGVQLGEKPSDTWHPSDEMADLIAQYLHRQQLL